MATQTTAFHSPAADGEVADIDKIRSVIRHPRSRVRRAQSTHKPWQAPQIRIALGSELMPVQIRRKKIASAVQSAYLVELKALTDKELTEFDKARITESFRELAGAIDSEAWTAELAAGEPDRSNSNYVAWTWHLLIDAKMLDRRCA